MAATPHLSHGTFGDDPFGRNAERVARFFGTPRYILVQTALVIVWIVLNSVALIGHWDAYPFILLNLAFSTQAAYAAPLILLAQTRQTERDKTLGVLIDARHTKLEEMANAQNEQIVELIQTNTALTQQVADLTGEIHAMLTKKG
ncbi:MAG: hypothetical protein QOI27_1261 [Gaiellaceae bacterium]|nr:hypothetical protein [Gaiellaceae bacterium]